MIAFDLCCDQDHVFEAWFQDNQSYQEQREQGLLQCPVCSSTDIRKHLSAVAVHTRQRPREGESSRDALGQILRRVYRRVLENTEDVGSAFAEQALKMHYGVVESRNIRGVATEEEEETLREEGISFLKVPVPAKDSTGEN